MAFASITAQLENRTAFVVVSIGADSPDVPWLAAQPNVIKTAQSSFWFATAPSIFDGGVYIRQLFAILDPVTDTEIAGITTTCEVPMFGANTYKISVNSAPDVVGHNGGLNTSVRFVLEGTAGAFEVKVFPQGDIELGEIGTTNGGGLGILEPTAVSAVSRSADKLDVFTTFGNGVSAGAWQPGDDAFRAWWPVAGNIGVPAGAAVTAHSRNADLLDVFVVTENGEVWTAAWQPGDAEFRGWWQLGTGPIAWNSEVVVVSRLPNVMDVFVTGKNGGVWTSTWVPGWSAFSEWERIGDLQVNPGTGIAAVSRGSNKIDIFAIGLDQRVYTAAWAGNEFDGWRGWWPIGDLVTSTSAKPAAVSRSADHLDIFVVGDDNRHIYTAAWQPGPGGWWGWTQLGEMQAGQAANVSAISAAENWLDIFVVGDDGGVYSAFWTPESPWSDWFRIGGDAAAKGSPVAAVSRASQKIDLFAVAPDKSIMTAAWEPGDSNYRGWWTIG